MEWYQILQTLLSLIFVIGLLLLSLWLFKFCEQKGLKCKFAQSIKKGQRIQILEKRILDSKNQIVLLSCDEQEYLLILTPSGSQLLTTSSKKAPNDE